MSDPVVVRLATVDDVAVLAEHRVRMFEDMQALPEASRAPLLEEAARWFGDAIPRELYVAFLAESGGAIVGGAGVQLRPSLPRASTTPGIVDIGPEALVVNVYVAPEWRRRGIARRLMDVVLEFTRARGIQRVALHASDDGRPLYEQLGFTPTNEMRFVRAPLATP